MFADAASGALSAANSWPFPWTNNNAWFQTMPAAWWASRICYGHIYPLERTGAAPAMSTITPSWNGSELAYAAHSGIPAITLDHGQAYYAHTERVGHYPLLPSTYDPANGDSLVYWSDGLRTRAVKAKGWAIVLEDAGPNLAATLAHASTPAPVATPAVNVAAIRQHAQGILALLP
jgi:hypothetical protein